MTIYEDLPTEEREIKSREYEEKGLKIPKGSEIEMTDWATQNGMKQKLNRKYFKVSNSPEKGSILVLAEGNRSVSGYWAGFWKESL